MKNATKLTCAALVAAGLSLAAVQTQAAPQKGMEKCYGIAKAGKNDCGGKGTGHSCQGQAKKSGDPHDWLLVPKGLCSKINGGSTTRGGES